MDAKAILEKYWDGTLPVDVTSIAKQIGITFKTNNKLAASESGYIRIDDDSNVICVINESNIETRQRFTIAHEIGHFVLGHLQGAKKLYRDTRKELNGDGDFREIEANNFAAQLLMPDIVIDWLINEESITSVATLADKLNVSPSAMRYRLKNLGWL